MDVSNGMDAPTLNGSVALAVLYQHLRFTQAIQMLVLLCKVYANKLNHRQYEEKHHASHL